MALLGSDEVWVGIEHRLDGNPRHPDHWPRAYVRVALDGDVKNMSPAIARLLAKHLVAKANMIDPPKPRVKRS